MAELKVSGMLTEKRTGDMEVSTKGSTLSQTEKKEESKPVKTSISGVSLPPAESAESIGANLDPAPRPMSGQELGAILVYRIAEQLAKLIEANPKFSEIVAYPAVKFRTAAKFELTFSTYTSGETTKEIVLETPLIEIDTKLHPNLADMLRLESGIGLWHRQNTPDGRYSHLLMRPSQKVMEHLLRMATDLGKVNGMTAGINKEEGK